MKAILTLSLLIVVGACQSRDSANESPEGVGAVAAEAAPQWVSLFDGESFEHWRGYKLDEMPEKWTIDDGAMFASEPGHGMDIVTRATYTNFELELEWKVEEGGNSGIMWHVDESAGDYPWLTGPEYQILDDEGHADSAKPKTRAASYYAVYAPTESVSKPAMEWNMARIIVNGNHVQHWLNDVMVVDLEKGSEDWQQRVAASKWKDVPTYGSTTTGHIAIQGDHGAVWFRNLRIRELD